MLETLLLFFFFLLFIVIEEIAGKVNIFRWTDIIHTPGNERFEKSAPMLHKAEL